MAYCNTSALLLVDLALHSNRRSVLLLCLQLACHIAGLRACQKSGCIRIRGGRRSAVSWHIYLHSTTHHGTLGAAVHVDLA